MSEMVDRVALELAMVDGWHGICVRPLANARKVWDERWEEADVPFIDHEGDPCVHRGKETYRKRARDIIAAMREPTQAMCDIYVEDLLDWSPEPGEGLDGINLDAAWRAMCDVALA